MELGLLTSGSVSQVYYSSPHPTDSASSGPAIEGLHDFRGTLAHSAAWDEKIDHRGKRVAVIGTGSSSIQMVPNLAKG